MGLPSQPSLHLSHGSNTCHSHAARADKEEDYRQPWLQCWPLARFWHLNTSGLGPGWLLSVRFLLLKFQIQNNKLRQELTHTPRREQNPDNRTRVTLVVKKSGICKVRFHPCWNLESVSIYSRNYLSDIASDKNLIAWTPHIPEAESSSTSIVFCCLTWRRQKLEQNPDSNCHNLALSCLRLLYHLTGEEGWVPGVKEETMTTAARDCLLSSCLPTLRDHFLCPLSTDVSRLSL